MTDTPFTNTTEDEIQTLVRNWELAIQRGDMDLILAHHTDDVVICDMSESPKADGLNAYRKTWELFFRFDEPDSKQFVIKDLEVAVGQGIAFAFCLLSIGSSGKAIRRLTLGLQRRDGRWLIRQVLRTACGQSSGRNAHEHLHRLQVQCRRGHLLLSRTVPRRRRAGRMRC